MTHIPEAVSRIEIRDALQRYARGLDRRDLELALSAFHDDARVTHGHFSGLGHDWVRWVFSNPPIDRVGIEPPSLNNLFLRLTGRALRD